MGCWRFLGGFFCLFSFYQQQNKINKIALKTVSSLFLLGVFCEGISMCSPKPQISVPAHTQRIYGKYKHAHTRTRLYGDKET